MPTLRPRHQVTETPDVARAIDLAARQWPNEPRSKLLLRLIAAGSAALDHSRAEQVRERRAAVTASSGKCGDAFGRDYLSALRQDWPA